MEIDGIYMRSFCRDLCCLIRGKMIGMLLISLDMWRELYTASASHYTRTYISSWLMAVYFSSSHYIRKKLSSITNILRERREIS